MLRVDRERLERPRAVREQVVERREDDVLE